MLWKTSALKGCAIRASDGQIGTVSDFLFDEASWLIRWLVVDTGTWLTGRKVLLPPSVLGHADVVGREFSVKLKRAEVENSPETDTDLPVSRHFESEVYRHYGWNPYWGIGAYSMGSWVGIGAVGALPIQDPIEQHETMADMKRGDEDPHLRSIEAVTGYHLHATDGEIGHVSDFMIEDADWSVHFLVADTRNWWPGPHVLISPRLVSQIRWTERLVYIDADRQKIKDGPPPIPR
ncbi:MAG: PRC-barrel domain-containing protein [Allgaiera sp.]|jgi:hypothetical protein|nr:PRC-barrel domain-containing protein [Allgaiera sp.]